MPKVTVPLPSLSEDKIKLFWSKVQIGTEDECWPWLAGRYSRKEGALQYGAFTVHHTQTFGAHRIAYFLTTGDDPKDLLVRHVICDNPPCCNPKHLQKGTYADNNGDTKRKGRTATGDRHSSRTHPERVARGNKNGSRTHPEKRPRGTRQGLAVLSEDKILEIRSLYQSVANYRALGRMFNVHWSTIRQIITRRTWTHI